MKRMRNNAVITALLLLLLMLCACQPTPETAPVVGKGDNHLEEMIVSSAASPSSAASASPASLMEAVGAPETFADSYTNEKGDVTVEIDASVEVPPVEALPAMQVKLCGFSQEQVDKLGEYFLKGVQAYEEEQVRTKEEIEESIVNEEQYLKDLKDKFTGISDEEIEQEENFIEELKKQYNEAPAERNRTSSSLQLQSDENGTHLSALVDLGKDGEAGFDVSSNEEYGSSFCFLNDGKGRYDYSILPESEELDGIPRGMQTTREEAESIVTQCLSDLCIKDMQIDSVKTATYFENNNDYNNDKYKATAKQCYVFRLIRTVNGVPVTAIEASTPLGTDDPNVTEPQEPEYNCVRDPESLVICIDDTGIVRFEWTNPSETEAVLSEHVTFLPFEDVVKKAKDNMFYKNYTAYGSTASIKITSIRLGMMRIMRKDKPGEYLMVPVWDFIGNHKDIIGGNGDWLPFGDQSYVTINAIDGSKINRDWGY